MKFVEQKIKDLLEQGIIEVSDSPWAAPIVLVPKPDGSLRKCTDFWKLNALAEVDHFPMPRVDDLLDKLGGTLFMTKLDMTKGYYQVSLSPASIPLTGYVTPKGHYNWRYMAFGLRGLQLHSADWYVSFLKVLKIFVRPIWTT